MTTTVDWESYNPQVGYFDTMRNGGIVDPSAIDPYILQQLAQLGPIAMPDGSNFGGQDLLGSASGIPALSPEQVAQWQQAAQQVALTTGGNPFTGLSRGIAAIGNGILDDPTRLLTGIDPIGTAASNLLLGQNNPALTNMFGQPSATSWERAQANDPQMQFGQGQDLARFLDIVAGTGLGSGFGAALGGGSGAAGSGAVAPTGQLAGTSLAGVSAPVGSTGGALGGATSVATLPALTVTGSGGGLLGGLSVGSGIAAGVGAGLLGQPTSVATLPETTVTGSNAPPPTTDWLGLGSGALAGTNLGSLTNTNIGTNITPTSNNQSGFGNFLNNMNWGGLINTLIGGVGSYLGNQQAGNAAVEAARIAAQSAYPYNVNLPGFGQSTFDPINRTATLNYNPALAQSSSNAQALEGMGFNQLMGLANSGQSGYGAASPQLLQQFQNMQNSPYNNPVAGIYGNSGMYNNLMNQAGGTAGNLFGQVGQGVPGADYAQGYMNAGQNFLGQATGMDVNQRAASYLDNMRQMAQFGETQAQRNNIENQFGRGVLASTAGGYQTQGLNQALMSADAQRQMQAHQMAMQDQQSLLGNAINAGNTGYGYLGQNQALQSAQLQNALAAQSGYQNMQQVGYGQGYQNNAYGQNAVNQAFTNAMNMFGVGQNAQQQQYAQASGLYQGGLSNNLNVGSYLQTLLGQGSNMGNLASGAAGTSAGIMAQQGQNSGNALAGFLNNLGSSVNWDGLFND